MIPRPNSEAWLRLVSLLDQVQIENQAAPPPLRPGPTVRQRFLAHAATFADETDRAALEVARCGALLLVPSPAAQNQLSHRAQYAAAYSRANAVAATGQDSPVPFAFPDDHAAIEWLLVHQWRAVWLNEAADRLSHVMASAGLWEGVGVDSLMRFQSAAVAGDPNQDYLAHLLQSLVLPRVEFEELTIAAAVEMVSGLSFEVAPDGLGVLVEVDPAAEETAATVTAEVDWRDIPVGEALRQLAGLAGLKLKPERLRSPLHAGDLGALGKPHLGQRATGLLRDGGEQRARSPEVARRRVSEGCHGGLLARGQTAFHGEPGGRAQGDGRHLDEWRAGPEE